MEVRTALLMFVLLWLWHYSSIMRNPAQGERFFMAVLNCCYGSMMFT
jgi:hypothetical protein